MEPDSNQPSRTSGTRRIIARPLGSSGFGRTSASMAGRGPEAAAADGPVPRPLEPVAEEPVAHVLGDPADLAVELQHALAERGHAHVPRAHRLVDERRVRAPAVRIAVDDGLVAQDLPGLPQ